MEQIFPEFIRSLPQADFHVQGVTAYVSQGANHQILFTCVKEDTVLPEHAHCAQWAIVLEGKTEIVIDGESHVFTKGDRYEIPEDVLHSGMVYAGYVEMAFFDDADRFPIK